ncbi:MAG TPA: signal peptidase I [Acidobacteriaceae bacterium]
MSATEQQPGAVRARWDENPETGVTPWEQILRESAYPRKKQRSTAHVLDMARSLLCVVVFALFVLTFIVQPFRIPSESMERTLLVGDFLLVNKAAYGPAGGWGWLMPYYEIRRGDIVVFHYRSDPGMHVVKRVIGVPGDHIRLQNGQVWVNNVPIEEPYVVYEPAYADDFRDNFPSELYTDPGVNPQWWMEMRREVRNGDLVVPEGDYFVMGDNRNFSLDSRYWGYVTPDHIVGRPFVIYFSLREPSATDVAAVQDDRLGQKSALDKLEDSARWDRFLRVVR